MGDLLLAEHDPGPARCVDCGAEAAGPCARCRAPLCADCCVVVTGSARAYALCRRCPDGTAHALASGWRAVLGWLAIPILGLALLAFLLERCGR
jgi:hypothetical protein